MTDRRHRRGLAPRLALAAVIAVAGCSLPHRAAQVDAGVTPSGSSPPAAPRVDPGAAGVTSAPAAGSSPEGVEDAAAASPAGLPPVPDRWRSWAPERPWFPQHRLVGYVGYPGAAGQGRLGTGELTQRVGEIVSLGSGYSSGRTVVPTLELIAATVHGTPGRDGTFRTRTPGNVMRRYLEATRAVGGLLLLNIQPGRSDFLTEVKALEPWLSQPDVGLALDPEWRMGPRELPMRVFGHVTGAELDAVGGYVSGLVTARGLPPKVIVYHQLHAGIVRPPGAITARPGVAWVRSIDGIGSRAMKTGTWRRLTTGLPPHIGPGFKLFFQEDRKHGPLMTPAQVLALTPAVDYVLYE